MIEFLILVALIAIWGILVLIAGVATFAATYDDRQDFKRRRRERERWARDRDLREVYPPRSAAGPPPKRGYK